MKIKDYLPSFMNVSPETTVVSRTSSEIIAEIHNAFDTEVDILLAEANIKKEVIPENQDLLDKADRLKSLGFDNSSEVRTSEAEIRRLANLNQENWDKEKLIKTINHFSFRYPHYKFITEDSVKKICEKYGLVYGPVSSYIGTVPDKNLKDLENFNIKDEDKCHQIIVRYRIGDSIMNSEYCDKARCDAYVREGYDFDYDTTAEECSMEIAAPLKEFNIRYMNVMDFKLSKNAPKVEDPIVLQPVHFEGEKHYLVITAWGDEATDELVANPILN